MVFGRCCPLLVLENSFISNIAFGDNLIISTFNFTSTFNFSDNYINDTNSISNKLNGYRGISVFTKKINGKQYVGSSNNLGIRLNDYFIVSYLINQSIRGSAISKALLKYGFSNFTLSVKVLGPSFN